MKKKRVLVVSNFCLANTGFGKNSKYLLTKLFESDKYELAEMAIGGVYPFEGAPEFEKTPWKTYGSLPRDQALANRLAQDNETYKTLIYGYYAIDDVVKDFKPDNVIFVEDPWGGGNLQSKPWWDNVNCYFWTTVDSTPILPLIQDQAKHMENYAVWADFAKTELEELNPEKKIDCLYACIDLSKYHPISKEEREKYRKQFKLQDSDFIVFMNSRNQLRKYFYSNIEGVAETNRVLSHNDDPEKESKIKKAKFLVNTCLSEGWNLVDLCKEYGLDKEDFLCSYSCSSCDEFFVSPFQGDNKNCPFCQSEKTFSTPTTKHGLREEDLNILYNISDLYSLPISSGGFEITLLEALAVGLPIATVDYSAGGNFTDGPKDGIYFFEYIFAKEIQSSFNKAIIEEGEVSNVILSHISSPEFLDDELKETNYKARREYANDKFNPRKTTEFFENWIDNSPTHAFDFDAINVNNANPDFKLEEEHGELSNNDFVELLYTGILLRPSDPKGKSDWLARLSSGGPREELYDIFINQAKQLKKEESTKVDLKKFIKDSGKKTVAYVITGSKSDCVASFSVIQGLIDTYPLEEWDHYLVTNQEYFGLFDQFDHFSNKLPYFEGFNNFAFTEGIGHTKGLFDVSLTPYILTQGNQASMHYGKSK